MYADDETRLTGGKLRVETLRQTVRELAVLIVLEVTTVLRRSR